VILKPHIVKPFFPPLSPDGFDVTKIRIIEPPGTRKSALTDAATIDASTNSTEAPAADIPSLQKKKKIKAAAVSRKRPFQDDSSVYDEEQKQRPRKKARIEDVHALVFPELYDDPHQPCLKKRKKLQPASAREESASFFNIFPKPSGRASRAVNQRFLSQIRQIPADEPNNNNDNDIS
jgi:hypothetical protein